MSEITITDATFEKDVLKSSQPVLVDFWAVWCVDPKTNILKNKYSFIKAASVKQGDSLTGWLNGKSDGLVAYSVTAKDAGHCSKIRTITGRELKLTDEHTLYTQRGWIKADQIKTSDSVAVLPVRQA